MFHIPIQFATAWVAWVVGPGLPCLTVKKAQTLVSILPYTCHFWERADAEAIQVVTGPLLSYKGKTEVGNEQGSTSFLAALVSLQNIHRNGRLLVDN